MTPCELSDLQDEYTMITLALDEDDTPYIVPHIYGHVDVNPRQGIRMLQVYTVAELELSIETLQEIMAFKSKWPD